MLAVEAIAVGGEAKNGMRTTIQIRWQGSHGVSGGRSGDGASRSGGGGELWHGGGVTSDGAQNETGIIADIDWISAAVVVVVRR